MSGPNIEGPFKSLKLIELYLYKKCYLLSHVYCFEFAIYTIVPLDGVELILSCSLKDQLNMYSCVYPSTASTSYFILCVFNLPIYLVAHSIL